MNFEEFVYRLDAVINAHVDAEHIAEDGAGYTEEYYEADATARDLWDEFVADVRAELFKDTPPDIEDGEDLIDKDINYV